MTVKIAEVRKANRIWFTRANQIFFDEYDYRVLHSAQRQPYLIRQTSMWSDMLGEKRKYYYKLNFIEPDLSIGKLIQKDFHSLNEVKAWLKGYFSIGDADIRYRQAMKELELGIQPRRRPNA